MSIALRLNPTTGLLHQFNAGETLEIDVIDRLSGSGNMQIGGSLGAAEELRLGGAATSIVRILGDFVVDGSSTVSTNETVTGTLDANGDVNLGDNSGDTITLGGGTSDSIVLLADILPGAGVVGLGSGVTQFFDEMWLGQVNINGPNLAAYNLGASGTNAGAYAIGVDPALIANSASTDLMTMLDDLDQAISAGGGETLQQTYALGSTIAVTSANGIFDVSNDTDTDTTTALRITRAPTVSTAGIGVDLSMGANTTGVGLQINQLGSGDALNVQDGGAAALRVTGAGEVSLTPTSGQNATVTAAGGGSIALTTATGALSYSTSTGALTLAAGAASSISTSAGNLSLDAAAAELVFDDVGNSGLTLSQTSDRTLDRTGSGEVLDGATSLIGAINRLANEIDISGTGPQAELPIESGVVIAVGDSIAQSTVAGRITLANANAAANVRVIGVALTAGTGDAGGTVLSTIALPGAVITDAGAAFTAGQALFAPDGTGRPVATAPANDGDMVQRMAWAIDANSYVLELAVAVIL